MNLRKYIVSSITGQNNLLFIVALLFFVTSTFTRLALLVMQVSNVSASAVDYAQALLSGLVFDAYIALSFSLLYALFLLILPNRWIRSAFGRWMTFGGLFVFVYGVLYFVALELFFFDEFSSRLNYVAVDYLLYPHEVFVNLWEAYPVAPVLFIDLTISIGLLWILRRRIRLALETVNGAGERARTTLALIVFCATMYFSLNIDTGRVSDDRVLNEIAGNGVYSFFHAFVTSELDYDAYYATITEREALERLRRQVKTADAEFLDSIVTALTSRALDRQIISEKPAKRFNIVLVLEESFGSEFVGSLKPTDVIDGKSDSESFTPHFDSLARQGLLFTNMYATGNRTVRGLEATVISFPPIAGRSIVKRPGSENLFTLASALKREDYQTVFLYGGHAYFDNFAYFAANNEYDKVIDENDFSIKTFSTVWGVCDEDLFNNALGTFDSLHNQGKPFFATIITVSNHTPFTYPEGKIPFDPERRLRKFAVRYADYAIGRFIADAREHEFFDSTLFVFVADHGARVYGHQEIPMDSYEIPLLFYCPTLIPEGRRLSRLGSQLDVAPTILDMLDFSYQSRFFGRSLLRRTVGDDWILLSHNRDVAMLRNDTLAILGIRGGSDLWSRDSLTGEFSLICENSESSLSRDAISYFQIGYLMYKQGLLRSFQSDAQ